MDGAGLVALRLANQRLVDAFPASPDEVVRELGAVQAQDFAGAKWAVARRAGASEAEVDDALAAGRILRTHVLRPTWHFVAPEDLRWMLALTAARINAAAAAQYRTLGLDDAVFARTGAVIRHALEGGRQLTRAELNSALLDAGIDTSQRLSHITMRAELDALICSGPPRGKHQTYALLDEWAPQTRNLSPEKFLTELAFRYFSSHGPATLKDFAWWSGLSVGQARAGIEAVRSGLDQATMGGDTYWFPAPADESLGTSVLLLPNYDEYLVAYRNREAAIDATIAQPVDSRDNLLFNNVIVVDGLVTGTWKRTLRRDTAELRLRLFRPLTAVHAQALHDEATRYATYLGRTAELVFD